MNSQVYTIPEVYGIFNQYDAWKNTWTNRGISRFIVTHEATIRLIIPSSNPLLMQRFNEILPIAKKYANIN